MELVIQRKIDDVGRLVIPRDIRRVYDIKAGDTLRFITTKEGILIRKVKE